MLSAQTGWMESPMIRLHPTGGNISGNAADWTWEILLRNKTIASGTSSGSQEHAYTIAREALLKYRNRESRH
jgi:hypothetical protein